MHAKVLIVDAIATNRIVLKVKLASAFYEVSHAATVAEASQQALEATPDLIICGANLPDGDAAGLVKALAQLEETAGASGLASVPVLALAPGLNGIARQCLLSAGVADVVADLENEALLVARVRSLIRAHIAENEWEIRDDTTRALGLNAAQVSTPRPAKVIVVADDIVTAEREARALRPLLDGTVKASLPSDALNFPQKGFGAPTRQRATRTEQFAVFGGPVLQDYASDAPNNAATPDIFVLIASAAQQTHMLSLISSIRCYNDTRHCGILMVHPAGDATQAAQALDMGADAVMAHHCDVEELTLRLRLMMQRKEISDRLRATMRTGLEAAVSDPLTGLHNRRYALPHLTRVVERAAITGRSFAVMIADLDHFKQVNDAYGHAVGDAVLVETARRLRENMRAVDMIARIGGEEFLIVLPGIELGNARRAGKRLCDLIGSTPFQVPGLINQLSVTISMGLAIGGLPQDIALNNSSAEAHANALIARADKALYAAKTKGRNCVTLSRPAA